MKVIPIDRALSIIGVLLGIAGIAVGVYIAKPEPNTLAISISGWVASFCITIALAYSAFKSITHAESELVRSKDEALAAYKELSALKDNMAEIRLELVSYRNIATTLTSVINPEGMKASIRNSLAAHAAKEGE